MAVRHRGGSGPWRPWSSTTPARSSDRKSTRLNSSHSQISYAVFCLKKKNKTHIKSEYNFTNLKLDSKLIQIIKIHHNALPEELYIQILQYMLLARHSRPTLTT